MSTPQSIREKFAGNPDDGRGFEMAEEQLFLAGQWGELCEVYRLRLAAPVLKDDTASRARLLFRLGQVLEERCCEIDSAIEQYWAVARLEPNNGAALRQLRQIHASREQWDLVLQIAEMEGDLEMQPYERAAFLASMGEIWRTHIEDLDQAERCFAGALELDPGQQDALAGRARTYEQLGRSAEAAAVWESLISVQRGPDRAPSLVCLAKLALDGLGDRQRAGDLYRRALSDDPRNEAAVEALIALGRADDQWSLLADLFERRFDLATDPGLRAAVALEAGTLHLHQLDDPQMARMWFNRALELTSNDVAVYHALAELERRAGRPDALLDALERIVALSPDDASAPILLEAAELLVERGEDARALPFLRFARERGAGDAAELLALARVLERLGLHNELADVLEQRAALAGPNTAARAEALEDLGRLYDEQMGDPEAAIEAFAGAFACQPERAGLAATLERLFRKAEAWGELRDLLEIAAVRGPELERGALWCSFGEVLANHFEEFEPAGRAFESALSLDPNTPRALTGMARLAVEAGDDDLLLRACEREAGVTSDRARLAELVGELDRLHCERGHPEDALPWVERLAEACPETASVWQRMASLNEALGREAALIASLEQLHTLVSGVDQGPLRLRLAALENARGDRDAALHWYEAAAEAEPSNREALEGLISCYRAVHRLEDVARAQRRLAEQLPGTEQVACLVELAQLLEDQLGDIEAAIVVLWRLVENPDRPPNTEARLEGLLERAGRFEELAQYLLERRRGLDATGTPALQIDLRRAELLLRQLGQVEEAAVMYRSLRERDPQSREIADGLEQALRAGNDPRALVAFLSERVSEENDSARRAQLELECAGLLEESGEDEALDVYRRLADDPADGAVQAEAGERLERLLERGGAWSELRQRLERRLGSGDPSAELALRERLATLCRDRLGEREPCAVHLEAAGAIAPHRPDIWRGLAILYLECDRPRELLRVLEAELATGPDREREHLLHLRIAGLLLEHDDNEGACWHFERVLVLDPGHTEAAEFLVEHYVANGRFADTVNLLNARLASANADADDPGRALSLRMRIAALQTDELNDVESAIDTLEPALGDGAAVGLIAAPLADLYQRAGHIRDLASVCRAASGICESHAERAGWMLRLGDALRSLGGDEEKREAVEAYRAVLAERPGDASATSALRELYRGESAFGKLAELLASEVSDNPGAETLAYRAELAELLGGPLERPAEALDHWMAAIALDRNDSAYFERAITLAERLGRHEDRLTLLDTRLASARGSEQAASLLELRGDLQAGPLEQPSVAVSTYRECLVVDPERHSARRSLRAVLEAQQAWPAVLDCLYVEARSANGEQRAEIFEQAVSIAETHLSSDARLPWLERLRNERPQDASVVARIGDVHREAGRPEALLRALEDELALIADPCRIHAIHCERARMLERNLQSPGRAIAALEMARGVEPHDPEVLAALDRLYTECGWVRERLDVLEARLASGGFVEPRERLEWHRAAATAATTALADPQRALPHRLQAVALSRERGVCEAGVRRQLVHELAETLRASGRMDLWSRAAEAEIDILPSDDDGRMRELELRRELAWTYERVLAQPDGARRHLVAILDREAEHPGLLGDRHRDQIETALLDRLRADRNHVDLARRLSQFLERATPDDAAGWLELARLRDEQLHAPASACTAYREALACRPKDRQAIRGLRDVSERLADWATVCEMLEAEIGLDEQAPPTQLAALLRRLGELRDLHLRDSAAAIDAYTQAIHAAADDLIALRALQRLHCEAGDPARTVAYLEREIELLGDADSQRRQEVWLQIADGYRNGLANPSAALEAFEAAAEAMPLPAERQRQWARLYSEAGDRERFVEVFAAWCDREDAVCEVVASDLLELSQALRELGRSDDALVRAIGATRLAPRDARGWDALADLHEERGDPADAAGALERAASVLSPPAGAWRLIRGALGLESSHPERCADLFASAVALDPGSAPAWAHRARVCIALARWEEAETAAARALDLGTGDGGQDGALEASLLFESALHGGLAAREAGRLEPAARFFGQACALDDGRGEAFEACGEVLFLLGDLPGARRVLERWLELDEESSDERRARHLSVVGTALVAAGDEDAALEHFERALEADPAAGDAHAGRAHLLRCAGRTSDAVAAFEAWGAASTDTKDRAARVLAAAEIEREAERFDDAEVHLREAAELDPGLAAAWVTLVEQLWQCERGADALDAATQALAHVEATDSRARLAWVRGQALENDPNAATAREAAEAYGEVVECDLRHTGAAMARARLLRESGDWQGAADALDRFATRFPDDRDTRLARIFHERGRLLAGPLEDMQGATRCYQRAIELDAGLLEAREPLARLLSLVPDRWRDAAHHHRALLATDPTRVHSIRSVLEIARQRGEEVCRKTGLALLQSLGSASPEERTDAPAGLPLKIGGHRAMARPGCEALRLAALEIRKELSESLVTAGVAPRAAVDPAQVLHPRDFSGAFRRVCDELSAPGLTQLPDETLREVLQGLGGLGFESGVSGSEGHALEGVLERAVGRWPRRKLRRAFEGLGPQDVQQIDPATWREDLEDMARCSALDATGDLRGALLALISSADEPTQAQLGESENIAALVAACGPAKRLLAAVVDRWCHEIENA